MDAETVTFITKQNRELKDDLKDIIEANGTAVRGKIESEVDFIKIMDEKRNGRIEKAEENIKEIKKETRVSRWAHRNPKVAIITVAIFIASVSIVLHTVGVKKAVDRLIRIELKN